MTFNDALLLVAAIFVAGLFLMPIVRRPPAALLAADSH
jgi:hypothetical protein